MNAPKPIHPRPARMTRAQGRVAAAFVAAGATLAVLAGPAWADVTTSPYAPSSRGDNFRLAPSSQGSFQVLPGDTVSVGYTLNLSTLKAPAVVSVLGARMTFPVLCDEDGPVVGHLVIPLANRYYDVDGNDATGIPGPQSDRGTYRGYGQTSALCGEGAPEYIAWGSGQDASFAGRLESSDTRGKIQVRFYYQVPVAQDGPQIDCGDAVEDTFLPVCSHAWTSSDTVRPDALASAVRT